MKRPRITPRDETGMTLVELLVGMIIFSILMAFVFTILIQILNLSWDSQGRVVAAQEARLGIAQIDRQIRSGNVILDPSLETVADSGVAPYYSMRIYTQADGESRCAQWRVIDHGDGAVLEFRSWSPNYPTDPDVTDWGVVARDIVIQSAATPDPNDSSTWPPFWKDPTTVVAGSGTGNAAQTIRITLHAKGDSMREAADPVTISTVVTGRNTVLGYSASYCSAIPAP